MNSYLCSGASPLMNHEGGLKSGKNFHDEKYSFSKYLCRLDGAVPFNKVIFSLVFIVRMSGKNKSTLSANKMIRQIQESFITREDEEPEYYTLSPSPSPSSSPPMSKRSRKRSGANFKLGDQSDYERLSFSVLARTKSQGSTPKNMNLVQQSGKEETEETISKKGK